MLSHPLKTSMILRLIGLNGPSREKKSESDSKPTAV